MTCVRNSRERDMKIHAKTNASPRSYMQRRFSTVKESVSVRKKWGSITGKSPSMYRKIWPRSSQRKNPACRSALILHLANLVAIDFHNALRSQHNAIRSSRATIATRLHIELTAAHCQ